MRDPQPPDSSDKCVQRKIEMHMKAMLFGWFWVCGLALAVCAQTKPLYENNFEKAEVGKVPEDFLVLDGGFVVKEQDGNKVLELPGSPLDSYAVQFGPAMSADVAVTARIAATAKGRRFPTFGVSLNGVGGYRLQVTPGKKSLEIFKDTETKASAPFEWKSGEWTVLRLQVRKLKAGGWKIEGKAWSQGAAEPDKWMLSVEASEEPPTGRASVFGSPFSGTPLQFDDLVVSVVVAKE
jgi:hypothetical protein